MAAPTFTFIYLASQSPRRAQLLEQIGVAHRPLLPGPHEDAEALEALRPGEAPATYVQRVTRLKLKAALDRLAQRGLPPAPVLCADTTVCVGRAVLGKPADDADARRMLRRLAGTTHRVLTAVAVGLPQHWTGSGRSGAGPWLALSESRVRIAPLTSAQIAAYVASGEPRGKAGAYAVQGRMAAHIAHISGSYSGIMGLPLHETAALLHAAGWRG